MVEPGLLADLGLSLLLQLLCDLPLLVLLDVLGCKFENIA